MLQFLSKKNVTIIKTTIKKVIKGKKFIIVVVIIEIFCKSGGDVKVRVLWKYTKEKTNIMLFYVALMIILIN